MKNWIKNWNPLFVAMFVMAVILMWSIGCAVTSRENYARVQDSYISAVTILVEARDAGKFTAEKWEDDILPHIISGDKLLDEIDVITAVGGTVDLSQIRAVLNELKPFFTANKYY